MKWVIIKGVRYPSSVISAFAAYNMDEGQDKKQVSYSAF